MEEMGIKRKKVSLDHPNDWTGIISRAKEDLSDTIEKVKPICERVRLDGDRAVLELTESFDNVHLEEFVIPLSDIHPRVSPELEAALQKAKENILEFHEAQKPADWEKEISGNRLGIKHTPVESVSVYAPGGKALYPSSILMGILPAKVAGVPKIQVITPPQKDGFPDMLLYTAKLAGADSLITVGGAQAIAAVAYGTETIPKSEFVVGPGNRYVAAAKSYLAGIGQIGIESPAGPSEVLILADDSANPEWVACDMLSQAEHGEDSPAILVTDSEKLADAVELELEKALSTRTKRIGMKRKAIEEQGWILIFPDLQEGVDFSNLYAPEHLEIMTRNPRELFGKVLHAGSVFLGQYSPVAMGDYITGTNHILPTAGGSRIYSSLGVASFLKRVSFQEVTQESLRNLYPYVATLSEMEGLDEEHGTSVRVRL